jgi:hypothetical protein
MLYGNNAKWEKLLGLQDHFQLQLWLPQCWNLTLILVQFSEPDCSFLCCLCETHSAHMVQVQPQRPGETLENVEQVQ